jgi:hypothetical protein
MMTGPEHYTSAEQHLDWAEESDAGSKPEKFNLAAAQVHATLALAAATAISRLGAELSMPLEDRKAWLAAARTEPPEPDPHTIPLALQWHKFAAHVAGLHRVGDLNDDGTTWGIREEDAEDTVNGLIDAARKLLGYAGQAQAGE